MSSENTFTKENLDNYLKELAKAYRKINGKTFPAEVILVGGAAVLANYGFRDMTTDIDALIFASSAMKDAINLVGDRFQLPNGWINADFLHTTSYSEKIVEFSEYYRTFSNVLTIRTMDAEYLIAMKLRAGRPYKNDLSDIVGILMDHQRQGKDITMEQIQRAYHNLYGSWNDLPEQSRVFIDRVMEKGNYAQQYQEIVQAEKEAGSVLKEFQKGYPGVINEENANTILKTLSERKSVMERIQGIRGEKQKQCNYSRSDKEPEI